MRLTNLELHSKIKDLLLNKIENLKWNYFDFDLNASLSDGHVFADEESIRTFFKSIELDKYGNYKYTSKNDDLKSILTVVFTLIDHNPNLLIDVLRSLFKNNDIKNESQADEGLMGKLNRKNRESRNEYFKKKIRDGFRSKKERIVVLAEGDSWFQFPRVYVKDPVKDIIDWLIDDPKYAVKSLASGGDWLSNIFYSGEYIEELPKVSPDVFLISGGGNDLVGNNRLALMVRSVKLEGKNNLKSGVFKELLMKRAKDEAIDIAKYERGLSFVSKEFFKFLNIYFVQYFVFLYNIANHEKYQNMMIITQGYDFAIPYNKNRGNWVSFQRLVNEITDTGRWLFEPLNMKGITNKDDQAAVVYTLIYEFNEMMVQLANFNGLKNLFHIDCRGFAEEKDWFDELHLKSSAFKEITNVFKFCITENINRLNDSQAKKVYRVVDELKQNNN